MSKVWRKHLSPAARSVSFWSRHPIMQAEQAEHLSWSNTKTCFIVYASCTLRMLQRIPLKPGYPEYGSRWFRPISSLTLASV